VTQTKKCTKLAVFSEIFAIFSPTYAFVNISYFSAYFQLLFKMSYKRQKSFALAFVNGAKLYKGILLTGLVIES